MALPADPTRALARYALGVALHVHRWDEGAWDNAALNVALMADDDETLQAAAEILSNAAVLGEMAKTARAGFMPPSPEVNEHATEQGDA